jgi:hypothetical protein
MEYATSGKSSLRYELTHQSTGMSVDVEEADGMKVDV